MDLVIGIGVGSLIISVITLAAFVWGFGYRWGRLVGRILALEDKVAIMYRVFVENALLHQTQQGMISHTSPYKLTIKGRSYPPLLSMGQMQGLNYRRLSSSELFLNVVNMLGMDTIVEYCLKNEITVSQAVANTIVAVHTCEDVDNIS